MFGSQRSLVARNPSSSSHHHNRSSSSAAYFNVSAADSVTITLGKSSTAKNSPQLAGNPSPAIVHRNSDPVGITSAVNYYNVPRLVPRNLRGTGQSEANPPIPRRNKPLLATGNCVPADLAKSLKDSATHSYYVYSVPPPVATADVNHFPAGQSTRSDSLPRSESLNNVGSSSLTRNAKPSSSNNSNSNRYSGVGGRPWRHYSVGDIFHKLQSVVSGGLSSLPRGLVRSISRFSVSQSSTSNPNPMSSPTKVSPDQSGTSSGLKRRWASDTLYRTFSTQQQSEDIIITPPPSRNSPTPEKEAPPRPPPRLVVRKKPSPKMKVCINTE